MRRKFLAALSTAVLLAGLLLAALVSPVAASGQTDWTGNGWPNPSCNTDPQTMLWIFTGKGDGADLTNVVLHWDTGQSASMETMGNGGGSFHATVAFFDPTANEPIYVTYDGTLSGNATLTLSGCDEASGPGTEVATITTEVHLGDDHSGGTTVVDNSNPAPFGSDVHDSAHLTFTGGGSLPDNSTVVFYFWNNDQCSGTPDATSDPVAASGTSPIDLDPEFVQGPLGSGGHAYLAFFFSGDTALVADDSGDCEPFAVSPPETQTSEITTEVHLGADDSSGTTVVGTSVDLGSTVHDSAHLTFTGGGTLPDNSNVVFKFWSGSGCPDSAATYTSSAINVSGQSSAIDLDPELAEGPLTAGDYSYQAIFTSGDTSLVTSDASDCEPFSVNQAGSSTSTSVIREDNGTPVAVGGTVPVGTAVHDTATVGTQVGSITITGTVTYHFFYRQTADPNCDATYEVTSLNGKTWPQTKTMSGGLVPASQSTGALTTPGYYSFDAVYSGDGNYAGSTSACEPFSEFNAALTIGYWGNHLDATLKKGKPNASCSNLPNGTSCSTNGPWTAQYLGTTICSGCVVGNLSATYSTGTSILNAAKVFSANNCANATSSDSNAAACLAAQLLGAELNVANGANNCACGIIAQAKAFLTAVGYAGPGSKVTFDANHTRAMAISLKTLLDNYNNNKGCS